MFKKAIHVSKDEEVKRKTWREAKRLWRIANREGELIKEALRQRKRREKKASLGLCALSACPNAALPTSLICLEHSRKQTLYMRKKRGGTTETASKYSPLRPKKLLLNFKLENPQLAAELKSNPEALKWIKANLELFWDVSDGFLFNSFPFPNLSSNETWMDSAFGAAWLENNGGLSLEDQVIRKIDREKEEKAAYV